MALFRFDLQINARVPKGAATAVAIHCRCLGFDCFYRVCHGRVRIVIIASMASSMTCSHGRGKSVHVQGRGLLTDRGTPR